MRRAWEKVIRKGADSWFYTGISRDRPCTFKRLPCTHICPVEGSVVPSSINQLSSNKIQPTNSKFPGKQLKQASYLGCVLLERHPCLL